MFGQLIDFFIVFSPFFEAMFHCNVDLAKCPMQPFSYLKLLQTCELIFQDGGGLNWLENLNKSP